MDHGFEDEQGVTYNRTVSGEKQGRHSTQDTNNSRKALQSGTPKELTCFSGRLLSKLCQELGLSSVGGKKPLIKRLLEHVSTRLTLFHRF